MIDVYNKPVPVDILAIGVHPDDVELSCSGTLLKHISLGHRVGIVDLTRGELGSRGTPDIRLEESLEAAKLMNVAFRVNLEMADGFFEYNRDHLIKIIRVIRMSTPRIVLCNALEDRHPDHGRSAKLESDACFYSGLRKIVTGELAPHRPQAIYHYIQDRNLKPDLCVDITGFEDKKMAAIACFATQFYTGKTSDGPNTPISSAQFMKFIKAKMVSFGRSIGVDYAEGFNSHRTVGINDLLNLV